ncbi:hypothetical protein KCP75_12475 [Salmonella enterica subsp. enterica]|nr:hypothetical protein KCP75_12475 [Salmonella enterica subsp. enterica]
MGVIGRSACQSRHGEHFSANRHRMGSRRDEVRIQVLVNVLANALDACSRYDAIAVT